MISLTRVDVYRPERIKYLSLFADSVEKTRTWTKAFKSLYDRTSNGEVSITYERDEFGRFHPTTRDSSGLSMTRMPREVRNWLAVEGAVDVDIINAAPSVIVEVCNRHDITCDAFKDFVRYADGYKLTMGSGFKDAKNKTLFSSHPLPFDAPMWRKKLRAERQFLVEELSVYYPQILAKAEERNEQKRTESKRAKQDEEDEGFVDNVAGLFLSYLYQQEEGYLIQALDEAGRQLQLWDDAVSLIYDGLMVHRPRMATVLSQQQCLIDLQDLIDTKTGISIKLAFKPLTPILDIDATKFPDTIYVRDGHLEGAKYLAMAVGDYYVRDAYGEYVKDDNTWTREPGTIKDYFLRTCQSLNMKRLTIGKDGEEKESLFSSMTDTALSIVKAARSLLTKNTITDFSSELVLGTEGKIFFKNGSWDFEAKRFIHGDTTNTIRRILHDFPPRVQEDMDFVMDTIIKPIFDTTEEGTIETFLHALSRAMAGKMDKATYIVFGPRNSGKSIIFQLVSNTFGGYVSTMPSSSFAVGAGGGGDAYRSNGFMVDVEYARIVKMSELPPDNGKSKVRIDGSKIKVFQSMKEGIQARALHQMQRTFYSLATGFFLLNDVPEFSPADSFDQCILFEFPNQFVSPNQMPVGPREFWTPEDEHKRIADPSIEKHVQNQKYRNAFLHIVLDAYREERVQPLPSMEQFKIDMAIGTGDDAYESVVEITMNRDDVVIIKDLRDALAKAGIRDNNTIIGRTLKRMVTDRFSAERTSIPTDLKGQIVKRGDPNYQKMAYRYIRLVKTGADNVVGFHGGNQNDGDYSPGFFPNPR